MSKKKCFTCKGKGYYYLRPLKYEDGKLVPGGEKQKIICPNCTANRKANKKAK